MAQTNYNLLGLIITVWRQGRRDTGLHPGADDPGNGETRRTETEMAATSAFLAFLLYESIFRMFA